MGDAGIAPNELAKLSQGGNEEGLREIHVLVTGFGPFNTFTTNPSWLIASALPSTLDALPNQTQLETSLQEPAIEPRPHPLASLLDNLSKSHYQAPAPPSPLRPPNTEPYKIIVHTYPSAIRVAYASTATLIPSLLNPATNPERRPYDYVLHIGLASGRDSYTLETQAHIDSYVIPDIDAAPGFLSGEKIWRSLDVPGRLDVGWEGSDVLKRWIAEVERRQPQSHPESETDEQQRRQQFVASRGIVGLRGGSAIPRIPVPKRAVVKLSRDAGRFLCEFVLMCSLAWRWREGVAQESDSNDGAREKIGKVAFLHVPNGIEAADVSRGVMVAESAIRAIVASWEDGYRNPLVYAPLPDTTTAVQGSVPVQQSKDEVIHVAGAFETRGTGDALPTGSV